MVSSIKSVQYKKVRESYQQNPVIKGDFPVYHDAKELPVFKFNRFLSSVLVISAIASMISYSMVIAKENTVTHMHNTTNEINLENIELQTKLDYARSFGNINENSIKNSDLKKADRILEVKAPTSIPIVSSKINETNIQHVSGF